MVRALYYICLVVGVVSAAPIWAEGPEPFPDFTFKRIKVPPAGSGNRIDIQIDPSARISLPTPAKDAAPDQPKAASGQYAWYWDHVSPKLTDASPARLEQAVNELSPANGGPSVAAPRLQALQQLANKFSKDILLATIGTKVSPALVLAVIGVESGGRTAAVSEAGAIGVMQLIPDTAKRFGVTDSRDPADNIRGGVAYLDWLMKEFDSDPVLVLAAYNAGENAVRKNGGVPDYAETRDYVPKVLAAWKVARGLCRTPPQLMSDGCVFVIQETQNNE